VRDLTTNQKGSRRERAPRSDAEQSAAPDQLGEGLRIRR